MQGVMRQDSMMSHYKPSYTHRIAVISLIIHSALHLHTWLGSEGSRARNQLLGQDIMTSLPHSVFFHSCFSSFPHKIHRELKVNTGSRKVMIMSKKEYLHQVGYCTNIFNLDLEITPVLCCSWGILWFQKQHVDILFIRWCTIPSIYYLAINISM